MAEASEAPTDVGRLIDERPMSGLQIVVAVLCGLAIFLDGYDIQVMALAVPSLAREWGRPPSDFGLALSAMLIGLALGSGLLAQLGDRWGRRVMVVGSMAAMGVATTLTATATTPGAFVVWRLLTGVALGTCIPNCAAWVAEFAPLRRRSVAVGGINVAVGLGAFSAGFIAPAVIDAFGWRGIFLVGGVAPILVAVLIWLFASESLKFLVGRRPDDPRIAGILARIAPGVEPGALYVMADAEGAARGNPLELVGPAFRMRSLLMWAMVALNLFTLYVLISWLATLLTSAGWSQAHALQGSVLIQLGGVFGGIGLAVLLDRGLTRPSLIAAWLVTAAVLLLFLVTPSTILAWGALLLLVGAGISGTQLCLNALAAAYYPPRIKATGVGWVGVMGGIGSIAAPLAGAFMLRGGFSPVQVLAALTVPVLLCALGAIMLRREWQAY